MKSYDLRVIGFAAGATPAPIASRLAGYGASTIVLSDRPHPAARARINQVNRQCILQALIYFLKR